jgi:CSLREA domain-containing protein
VIVGAAIFALGSCASASASVLNVNTTADPNPQGCPDPAGACSLRAAIAAAGANDTIFVPASAAHYVLSRGPLAITKPGLVIIGADARGAVVDGSGASRVFDIQAGSSPSISDLTVMNGNSSASAPAGQGGGILVQSGATLTLSNSTVANNVASGSSINGSGGGISNAGTLEARGVTISGNVATSSPAVAIGLGGGIDNEGQLTLVNSTVANNTAGGSLVLGQGGGLVTGAGHTSTLTNVTVTVTDNQTGLGGLGPNLMTNGSGTARLHNTIVVGASGLSGANCSGPTQSTGNNLEDVNSCGFSAGGDRPGTNPQLGALGNNGGPTDTRALLSGSAAIDAGSNSGCPPTDQRGVPRPQGSSCDIGAFEVAVGVAAGNPNKNNSLPLSSVVPLGSVLGPATLGKTFNLVPVRGTVTYLLPNGRRYTTLVSAVQAPLGTIVEASNGTARVISARSDAGRQQSADFYDGPFEVRQSLDPRRAGAPRTGITDLVLRFGDFRGCDRADQKQILAVAARKKRRRLWGKGKGAYRTRGNYGSASVRGTWWFTKDICDGTEFYVREGTVKVRDNTRRRTVTLRSGQRYLAKAPPDHVIPPRGSQ